MCDTSSPFEFSWDRELSSKKLAKSLVKLTSLDFRDTEVWIEDLEHLQDLRS